MSSKTKSSSNSLILVWFRADLRIHDHPALHQALQDASQIVPVFVLDDTYLSGASGSSNRNRFLLECLEDLRRSLKSKGGDLIIRYGNPADELAKLAEETNASLVYYTSDFSPSAIKRDERVASQLEAKGIETTAFEGKLAVDDVKGIVTKSGSPYKVFTPFWKSWVHVKRRDVLPAPSVIHTPSIRIGSLPKLSTVVNADDLSDDVTKGGETEARKALHSFLEGDVHDYHKNNNSLSQQRTSRLSPYLHFGCLSVREIETMLPPGDGADAWHRQLAWRDFYHYVLLNFPNPDNEFQNRFRGVKWHTNDTALQAWKDGKTGYPVVDAAMRQLKKEGWMHNRARLIVGSFLTKDLLIDWREGESHFMQWLLDGDKANNNGNWQWIASVGLDPAPLFRRLYNPSSQRDTYDPDGTYVRTYVRELKDVPDEYLSEPWKMPSDVQQAAGCIIGKDYLEPIVDHKEARRQALEWYGSVE